MTDTDEAVITRFRAEAARNDRDRLRPCVALQMIAFVAITPPVAFGALRGVALMVEALLGLGVAASAVVAGAAIVSVVGMSVSAWRVLTRGT